MMVDRTCLVDSDVFITAKNLYHPFAICPGFWKCVVHHHREGRVFSVDRVRSELLAGHTRWSTASSSFCLEEFFIPAGSRLFTTC